MSYSTKYFKMSTNNETKFAYLTENKGLGDLGSKTNAELKELLDRQEHLLINKSLINKLKDKGEKIMKIRNEILQEIECRKLKYNININKTIRNSTAVEWRNSDDSIRHLEDVDNSTVEETTDPIQILSENGQVPNHDSNKSHATKLLEKEKDPDFSFKPYNPAVAEKIKKVVPDAHTQACSSLAKTIHLDESLNLLSQQMSALKILGTRSKRVEECIEDRMNETTQDQDEDDEEVVDETKIGLGIAVNVNVLS